MTQEIWGKWMMIEAYIASGALSHFDSPADSIASLRRWATGRGLTHILAGVPKRGYKAFTKHIWYLSGYNKYVIDHLFTFRNSDRTKLVVTSQPYHDNDKAKIDACHFIAAEDERLNALCSANYCLIDSWWYPGRTGTMEFWLRGAP